MRMIRMMLYILGHMVGLGNPEPQTLTDIEAFLVKHKADLSTAFIIETTVFEEMMQERFTLPQLKIYDSTGIQLYASSGWGGRGGRIDTIQAVLSNAPGWENEPTLREELSKYRSFADETISLEDLPAADYYFVEYWATWCLPCIFQMDDLHKFLATVEDMEIVMITVNFDLREPMAPGSGSRASK